MGITGGFPIDIVLFGMIAAFLVLRLRSILGRRTGFERPPQAPGAPRTADQRATGRRPGGMLGPVIEGRAEPAPAPASHRPVPDPLSPAGRTLARIRERDPGFDPQRFLAGAEHAFRMIVGAYAAGNRQALRPLLGDDTYHAFDAAITAREQAGETVRSEIRHIAQATIEHATLLDTLADITVRFVSDQINLTLGRDGNPTVGTDALTEITDIWTFERDLASRDHTWRLVAAQSG